MISLAYWLCAGFLVVGVHWLVKLHRTYAWLQGIKASPPQRKGFTILLPVLDERYRLEGAVRHLLAIPRIRVVIITCSREPNSPGNTISIATRLAKEPRVQHIHYPGKGQMAHQLNHAMRRLRRRDTIFAVYNADSRPDARTFAWVSKAFTDGAGVCQQYGDYTRNIGSLRGSGSIVLHAAAAWQNRWTAGFEMPHALAQYTTWRRGALEPFNYCIGHGLFFSLRAYDAAGGFCENTHNEDAIFGLRLWLAGIRIHPVPFLDRADTADTIRGLFTQQSNWFFGPGQAFGYLKHIRERRLAATLSAAKLWSHAVFWAIGPALWLASIIAAFSDSAYTGGIVLATLLLYLSGINAIAARVLNTPHTWRAAVGTPFFYLLHGLAAYHAMFRMGASLVGRHPMKDRTPMEREHA